MKIAIAGYGLEGEASYQYWNTPENDLTIVDAKQVPDRPLPEGVKTILGQDAFGHLDGFDMVIRTAGLPPQNIKTDGQIWSSTNEFFARCPAPIVGVTGTKGKGTTASLTASILKAAGKTVHLVGNIGVAPLGELSKIASTDVVVFELSSFQLWDLEKSPHVSVILMIEPDHLNVHKDFEEYIEAKANIRRYQTLDDACIYHPTNEYSRQAAMVIPHGSYERSAWESMAGRYAIPDDDQVYAKENTFFVHDKAICSTDVLRLPGAHNIENACAAISAALHFTDDYQLIERGLAEFEGLPHRLELVREMDGVKYYNDSFSSAPGATVAAINSFKSPEILILGGIDKGTDFGNLASVLKERTNIKQLIVIGEIRHKLADFMHSRGVTHPMDVSDVRTMKEIVDKARSYATAGDLVILSPACASFDMFKNFYDRGDQFRSIVQAL